jgi:hypothetical protein
VSLRGGFDLLHIGTKRKIQTKTKKKPMNNCKSKMWAKRLTFHFHGFFLTSLVLKKKFVNVQLLQVRKTGNTRNATNYNNGKTKCQDFEIVVKTLALQKKKQSNRFYLVLFLREVPRLVHAMRTEQKRRTSLSLFFDHMPLLRLRQM